MSLKCGIVGLPNVGKSTLFNALTNGNVPAENYPFCTIEPHSGMVTLPDDRLDWLTENATSAKQVNAFVEFVDIAGLVKGAYKGAGKGNEFLASIRETDALVHVVRCFDDEGIIHVDGRIDPVADAEVILLELIMADLQLTERHIMQMQKKARGFDKKVIAEMAKVEALAKHLEDGKMANSFEGANELMISQQLLTVKPMIMVANCKEDELSQDNEMAAKLKDFASSIGSVCLKLCSTLEADLSSTEGEDKQELLDLYGLSHPALDMLVKLAYDHLGLISFFTSGPKESRAWTITRNTLAPGAAAKIHTDIERGFICAEVVSFEDMQTHGSWQNAKHEGAWRQEGKAYAMQDGDVVLYRFNV